MKIKYKHMSDLIEELRKKKNLTIRELSDEIINKTGRKISKSTIQRLEQCLQYFTYEQFNIFSQYFGINKAYFLFNENTNKNNFSLNENLDGKEITENIRNICEKKLQNKSATESKKFLEDLNIALFGYEKDIRSTIRYLKEKDVIIPLKHLQTFADVLEVDVTEFFKKK